MPFEIGFVGATTKKQILELHHFEHTIKKHNLNEFVEVVQKDNTIQPANGKIEVKDNQVKVFVELPTSDPYYINIKKPFRLSSVYRIFEDIITTKRSLNDLINEYCSGDNKHRRELLENISKEELNTLK